MAANIGEFARISNITFVYKQFNTSPNKLMILFQLTTLQLWYFNIHSWYRNKKECNQLPWNTSFSLSLVRLVPRWPVKKNFVREYYSREQSIKTDTEEFPIIKLNSVRKSKLLSFDEFSVDPQISPASFQYVIPCHFLPSFSLFFFFSLRATIAVLRRDPFISRR